MAGIRILFGTETGNAEDCAGELGDALESAGIDAEVVDMNDYDPETLASEQLVFIITSTFGNGDPPANAEALMDWLREASPSLPALSFGVCALGDSTYARFAQCGRDFDQLLGEAGAKRVVDLMVCDADFDDDFETFSESVKAYIQSHGEPDPSAAPPPPASKAKKGGLLAGVVGSVKSWFGGSKQPEATNPPAPPRVQQAGWSAKRPFAAKLVSKRKLSGEGSSKETMHYELSLAGSGITFEPGDSFGVHPSNNPAEVESILGRLTLSGAETVSWERSQIELRELLTEQADLQTVTQGLAEACSSVAGPAMEASKAGGDALKDWRSTRFVVEALAEHPGVSISPQRLADSLRAMPPRLYSVANSPLVDADELAFTVETLRWEHEGNKREGVASTWLCDRLSSGDDVPLHKVSGKHFRLPSDGSRPIIMVGPGTGIAPFRAFLQQRKAAGDDGDAWLFFGHQHEAHDALYANELKGFLADGTLTNLHCAWSRDQSEKVYVQHKMQEHGAELYAWLERGAVLYVCGDKLHMASDVRKAVVAIVAEHGQHTADAALAYVAALETAERYRIDVY